MQNNFGGNTFHFEMHSRFSGKRGCGGGEGEEGGRGGDQRDRREGDVNTHFLYLFIKIKIRTDPFSDNW